ncbi:MAG: UbiA family prenyltransferase [Elusimicrobia bacterium]|nr:UbiA family prenyltransferase [Elusimicrobiota bacterium]
MTVAEKWWTYQRERFPVFAHGTLIAAFSFCAVSYSALLRSSPSLPAWPAFAVAFVASFLSFLMLRIADEFKDFEEDARWRPYRPVPRGLVTLRELGVLGVLAAAAQLAASAMLTPRLVFLLVITWVYLSLMSVEFFARAWLKARPFTYMWTHMMIMPLVDFFATGCDWMHAQAAVPAGLLWFLGASFFNGVVLEIGRKIRAPEDEEEGVETYSAIWGRTTAVGAWLASMALAAGTAAVAASRIHFTVPFVMVLGVAFAAAAAVSYSFLRRPASKTAKLIEHVSALWIICLYLSMGALPRLWQ